MTTDIKKSWFETNWNKPNRMKRHMKRYSKKSDNVNLIRVNAYQYKLTMPEEFRSLVDNKCSLYQRQIVRLSSIINAYFNGEITEENKSTIIDNVMSGKVRYYAKWKDEKNRPVISSFPPKNFFKKIIKKIVGN